MSDAQNGHHGGSIRTAVSQNATNAYSYAQRSLDRVVPPSSRQNAYDHVSHYARTRPILFSFIVAQFALSFLPLLTFAVFALSTVAFSLGSAILFSLFWIGVAFLLLVPAVLVTASIAVLVWAWAVGSFVVARWLYEHSPVAVQGDLAIDSAGRKVEVSKGEDGVDGKYDGPK